MSETSPLERWYRLLLRSYPARFRAQRGEELLTVLLACAPPDRRRPPPGEALNVVAHGLRTRLHLRRLAPASEVTRGGLLPSSGPLPQTYAEALRAISPFGLRPTVDDWTYRRTPTWLRAIIVAVIAAGALVVVVTGYHYYFTYAPFGRGGSAEQTTSVPVGSTVWVSPGLLASGEDSLRIDSITPRVLENTAAATVVVERCGGPQFFTVEEGSALCHPLVPYHGGAVPSDISLSAGHAPVQLLIAVTPHRPGNINIAGVTIHLHLDWRHGTQTVGIHWTITATR